MTSSSVELVGVGGGGDDNESGGGDNEGVGGDGGAGQGQAPAHSTLWPLHVALHSSLYVSPSSAQTSEISSWEHVDAQHAASGSQIRSPNFGPVSLLIGSSSSSFAKGEIGFCGSKHQHWSHTGPSGF